MKTPLIIHLFLFIIYGCGQNPPRVAEKVEHSDEANEVRETQPDQNEKMEALTIYSPLDSLNKINNKGPKALLDEPPISHAYLEGTSTYRTNLSNLVGRSVTVIPGINGNLPTLAPGANFKKVTFKKETTILENGNLVEHKITRKNENEISAIFGKLNLTNKQMNEFIISELSSLDIDEAIDLDMDKFRTSYNDGKLHPNTYIVLGATVVEVLRKTFYEKDMGGEVKIPIGALGGALGYDGKLFSQETSFIRNWRIYIDVIQVDELIKAYPANSGN